MLNYKKMYKKENSNQFYIKISQIKEKISLYQRRTEQKNKSTNSVWEIKDK